MSEAETNLTASSIVMEMVTPAMPAKLSSLVTSVLSTTPGANQTYGVMSKIFLQTTAAQAIAGLFAFAAILVTCHQVSI